MDLYKREFKSPNLCKRENVNFFYLCLFSNCSASRASIKENFEFPDLYKREIVLTCLNLSVHFMHVPYLLHLTLLITSINEKKWYETSLNEKLLKRETSLNEKNDLVPWVLVYPGSTVVPSRYWGLMGQPFLQVNKVGPAQVEFRISGECIRLYRVCTGLYR